MATIELRTELDCSCELMFTLSLDLDLELRATARFGSRIVGGRRGGRIGPGRRSPVGCASSEFRCGTTR